MRLLNKVDSWLMDNDLAEQAKKERGSHHPSGANKCMRQMYYEWTKEPVSNPRTATDVWRMSVGRWIHAGFTEVLRKVFGEDKVRAEVEMFHQSPELKYPIHGYIDDVIEVTDADGSIFYVGAELKTSFGRGISTIQKEGKPREDDETQAKIYVVFNDWLKEFVLPYLGRDSFYRTEFAIVMTEEEKSLFRDKVIARFKKFEDYYFSKTLPPRDYHAVVKDGEVKDEIQYRNVKYRSNWQCMYCMWCDTCYKKERESMDIIIPYELDGGKA